MRDSPEVVSDGLSDRYKQLFTMSGTNSKKCKIHGGQRNVIVASA